MSEIDAADILEAQHLEAGNKEELDYWAPLAELIVESVEARSAKGLSQQALAERMDTRQSVISRFENMGRVPSYDFIARMALALGHAPGITLYGEYMAVAPASKHTLVASMAAMNGISTKRFLEEILNKAISGMIAPSSQMVPNSSGSISTESRAASTQDNIANCAIDGQRAAGKDEQSAGIRGTVANSAQGSTVAA
jgi:transcriptional regulator with XRE-family HTH domain